MSLSKILRIAFVCAALGAVLPGYADGIDKDFFRKAARKAWALESEGIFNASTEIPDSISAGQSGVIIARHDDLIGRREEQNTMYNQYGRTNRTTLQHINRVMVKLLDRSAVERYSEFEFGESGENREYGLVLTQEAKTAFGARIHKPDGTVVDVSLDGALEVSDGKKGGSNKSWRLAVPGLEPGDVIEYFYYAEYMNEDDDIENVDMSFANRYPVMRRLITGSFDRDLTAEFRSYNGDIDINRNFGANENTVCVSVSDIPAVSFDRFLFEERQLPFLRLNLVNNYLRPGELPDYASTARRGGVYLNVSRPQIYHESMEYTARLANLLHDARRPVSYLPQRALKMTKDYMRAHPEATPREIADAACMALRYCNYVAKDNEKVGSSLWLALFHNAVMEGLDVYPRSQTGIGFVNSRLEVPTADIAKWSQTHFVSVVGDTCYMLLPGFTTVPGELPGIFQGEKGARLTGQLRDLTHGTMPAEFTVPDLKYSGNRTFAELVVSFDPEERTRLHVDRHVVLRGSAKSVGKELNGRPEWLREAEDFFGIPENKRYAVKGFDPASREREVRDALRDECRTVSGFRPDSIISCEIVSRGIMPGKSDMEYNMSFNADGLVEDLGGDLSVNLGRLLGKVDKIEGSERDRLLDAMLTTAFQDIHSLKLKVPEGYKVDETSLADFNRTMNTPIGIFSAHGVVNAEGDLEVQCVFRFKQADIPLRSWRMMLDLTDAAADFAGAGIILVPE
ncbi:MAG: DUF3857 domain-containing protein [Muribaculaceae bacterium]|nr:DUF3857 domain-containing protein [Muribaculaceae bacterium]